MKKAMYATALLLTGIAIGIWFAPPVQNVTVKVIGLDDIKTDKAKMFAYRQPGFPHVTTKPEGVGDRENLQQIADQLK